MSFLGAAAEGVRDIILTALDWDVAGRSVCYIQITVTKREFAQEAWTQLRCLTLNVGQTPFRIDVAKALKMRRHQVRY